MNAIEVTYIKCQCAAGALLFQAAHEAAILALTEKRSVVFTHNAKEYTVHPVDLVKHILEPEGDGQ